MSFFFSFDSFFFFSLPLPASPPPLSLLLSPYRHWRVVPVGDDRQQSALHPVLPRLLQGELHLERGPPFQLRQRRVLAGHIKGEALHQSLLGLGDVRQGRLLRCRDLLLVPRLQDCLEALECLVEPFESGVARCFLAGSKGGGDLSLLARECPRGLFHGTGDPSKGLGAWDAELLGHSFERRLDGPHRLVVDR